jgi:hypothetical protein
MYYMHEFRDWEYDMPERPPLIVCEHQWVEEGRDDETMASFNLIEKYLKCALCGARTLDWEEIVK